MSDVSQSDVDAIERIVDHSSVAKTLEALSAVCFLKAEHIDENWQDRSLASAWERAGKAVDSCTSRVGKIRVPGIGRS